MGIKGSFYVTPGFRMGVKGSWWVPPGFRMGVKGSWWVPPGFRPLTQGAFGSLPSPSFGGPPTREGEVLRGNTEEKSLSLSWFLKELCRFLFPSPKLGEGRPLTEGSG
jgi:hypothetical protein